MITAYDEFCSQIEATLARFPETGASFRLIVDKKNNLDTFDLKVEVKDVALLSHPEAVKTLQHQMAEAVKSITGNTSHVELVPTDSLPRATGGESKTASIRVEDRRKNKIWYAVGGTS